MKKWISVLLICVMVLTTAACGKKETKDNQDNQNQSKESVFTAAISYMPDTLAPVGGYDDLLSIVRPIYEPLFAEVTGDEKAYFLADSVEISEDKTTYTVHLNDKASWSDGKPVVADDVLFAVNNYKNMVGESSPFSYVAGQEIIYTVVDEKTVEAKLPMPYATFITTLAGLIPMPSHAFDNDPAKMAGSEYFKTPDMATSGAYTVAEINEDSIVYVKRDDYYRGTPSIDKVIMKTIGTGSTKQIAFEKNEISYMQIASASDLKKYENDPEKYNVYSIPQGRTNFFCVNPASPNLQDEDARKAVFLALDSKEMVDAAYGDDALATPATQYLAPQQAFYNKELKGYEQDLEEAKKLAKTSGLEGKTITYVYNKERAGMEEIATTIQQQLAKIGVNVELEATENATFLEKWGEAVRGNGTWDLLSQGFGELRGSTTGTWGMMFPIFDQSDEMKMLTGQANAASDSEQAKEIVTQMQEKFKDCYVVYPICNTNYVMVSQKNVTGLDGCPLVPEFMDYLKLKVN